MAIHVGFEEGFDGVVACPHSGGKAHDRHLRPAHRVGGLRLDPGDPAFGLGDDVVDEKSDQAPDELMNQPMAVEVRIGRPYLADDLARQRRRGNVVDVEKLGAQAVVDIVGVVSDIVGNGGDLRFGAGEAPQLEILQPRIVEDRLRVRRATGNGRAARRQDRSAARYA